MIVVEKGFSIAHIFELFRSTKNIRHSQDGRLIVRKGQCWKVLPPVEYAEVSELRKFVTSETQGQLTPHTLAEVIKLLRTDPQLTMNTECVINTGKIVFTNGIYDVKRQCLEEGENEEEYCWAIVNANYYSNCRIEDAPIFHNYVKSSLEYEENPDKTFLLLQILGYCLSDYVTAKKAFFLIGPPSSGKSIFLEFVRQVLDDEDTTQIAFAKLGDRFSKGALRESRINICSEMSERGFPQIDVFKALTGGDSIFGERKGRDGFSYRPKVKLLNAGNVMPIPKKNDGTEAIAERMLFLVFNKSIPRTCWKMDLADKLLIEKDIICSLAVDSLKGLYESNFQFCIPADSATYSKSYGEYQDSLKVFLSEECDMSADKKELSTEMWERYTEFCRNNSFVRNVTLQVFSQTVSALPGIKKIRERTEGGQKTFFLGIGKKREIKRAGGEGKIFMMRKNPFEPRLGNVGQKNEKEDYLAQEKLNE